MNKLTDPQSRIYAFIYELGKMDAHDATSFVHEVYDVLGDYGKMLTSTFYSKYPEFKLGEEARDAKIKVENLKPKSKKTTKEK